MTLITKDEKVQKAQSPETNFNPDKKKQDVERDAHQGRKRRKDSVQERHHRYAYATKKKWNRSINSPADAKSKKFELRRQRSILEYCIDRYIPRVTPPRRDYRGVRLFT